MRCPTELNKEKIYIYSKKEACRSYMPSHRFWHCRPKWQYCWSKYWNTAKKKRTKAHFYNQINIWYFLFPFKIQVRSLLALERMHVLPWRACLATTQQWKFSAKDSNWKKAVITRIYGQYISFPLWQLLNLCDSGALCSPSSLRIRGFQAVSWGAGEEGRVKGSAT